MSNNTEYAIALIAIKTDLNQATGVADAAASIHGVEWAMVVTGPYDVMVAIKAESQEALFQSILDELGQVSGVNETLTMIKVYSVTGRKKIPSGYP
jgi:DNA-binding Lrp family transcriptional regulator